MIERLVADLRRLECDYCRSLAYDDTLCACCSALEIPWSGRPPFDEVHRLDMEASLAKRGVTW